MAKKKHGSKSSEKTSSKSKNEELDTSLEGVELHSDSEESFHEDDHDQDYINLLKLQDSLSSLEFTKETLLSTTGDHSAILASIEPMIKDLELKIANAHGCDLDDKNHDEEEEELPDISDDESIWEALDEDGESVELLSEDDFDDSAANEESTVSLSAAAEKTTVVAATEGATEANIEIAGMASAKAIPKDTPKPAPKTKESKPPEFVPNAAPTKFAPKNPTVKGEYSLACISMEWNNHKGPGKSKAGSMGAQVRNHYASLSKGQLKYTPVGLSLTTGVNRSAHNLNKAEQTVKAKANALRKQQGKPPFDKFAYIHGGARDYSNAGKWDVHLVGTLLRTALHEEGHTDPTELGHASKYADGGKGKLDYYGDRGSFMGKYSSVVLNGPELWGDGWLEKEEVAQYDFGDEPITIDMAALYSKDPGTAVKGVLIPSKDGKTRDMFLSNFNRKGKNYLSLYYVTQEGRGTQQIKVFNQETEWNGLKVERIATNGSIAKLKLSSS